jgi:hypothetical protein
MKQYVDSYISKIKGKVEKCSKTKQLTVFDLWDPIVNNKSNFLKFPKNSIDIFSVYLPPLYPDLSDRFTAEKGLDKATLDILNAAREVLLKRSYL